MGREDLRYASRRLGRLCLGLALVGCGSVQRADDEDGGTGTEVDGSPEEDAGTGTDAGDASVRQCNPEGRFSPPVLLEGLSSGAADFGGRLSPDELTLYLASTRTGEPRMYVATRASATEDFSAPKVLSSAAGIIWPTVTGDGLTLFGEGDLDGSGDDDIWRATRKSAGDGFGVLENVGALNSTASDANPYTLADGEVLYMVSRRAGPTSIYRAARDGDDFAPPVLVLEDAVSPVVTRDERRMFMSVGDPQDIWTATRATPDVPFDPPVRVEELNSDDRDRPAWISDDGCRLYFASNRPGGPGDNPDFDLYFSEREPL